MASIAYSILHLAPPSTHRPPPSLLLPSGGGGGLTIHRLTHSRPRICLPERRYASSSLCCKSELTSNLAPLTSAVYGIFLLGGGLFAYSKSESKGSLFGGLTGAVLMGIAYRLMLEPETKQIGDALAFGSALLFASVFGIRLASTRKIMPGGVLLGLSVGALAVFYSAYLHDKL